MNFSAIPQSTLLGKLLRLVLRLLPSNAVVPILQGALRGRRWIVGSGTNAYWLGSFEPAKQRVLLAAITSGAVVYDIGAHVGYYTLLASKAVGINGQVIAFEPLPRNLAFLRQHVHLNHCVNTEVFAAAVADAEGQATFDDSLSSSEGHLSEGGQISVRVVCLDTLVTSGQIPPPNLCKIDIEGSEYNALRGAVQILQQYRPIIFVAVHSHEAREQCFDLLTQHGYILSSVERQPLATAHEVWATPAP